VTLGELEAAEAEDEDGGRARVKTCQRRAKRASRGRGLGGRFRRVFDATGRHSAILTTAPPTWKRLNLFHVLQQGK
jgi:hypothetical protein